MKREKLINGKKAVVLQSTVSNGVVNAILVSAPALPAPRWFNKSAQGRWISIIKGREYKKWYVLTDAINAQIVHSGGGSGVKITDLSQNTNWGKSYVALSLRECRAESHKRLWKLVNQTGETMVEGKVIAELA